MSTMQRVMVLFFIGLFSAAALSTVGPNWIEQWGITWKFDKNISPIAEAGKYKYGTFANGDYWVVGPVTIVSISPISKVTVDGDKDAVGSSYAVGTTINGSMLNMVVGASNGFVSTSVGWDADLNAARPNGANLSVENPLVLAAGSSLVSSESRFRTSVSGINTHLYRASVLTVLGEAPAAGSFRPPYAGTDKTIKFNVSDLDYSVLKNLEPNTFTVPSLDSEIYSYSTVGQSFTFNNAFDHVWIDHAKAENGRTVHPLLNMPEYGAGMCLVINNVALMLNTRQDADATVNNTKKSRMLIGLVQYGIDLYGLQRSGTYTAWVMEGGHGPGRRLPIIFAGAVLNDADMKALGKEDVGSPKFGEDETTYYLYRREVEKWLEPITESDPDYETWTVTWDFEAWLPAWGTDPGEAVKVKYCSTSNYNRNKADAYYSDADFIDVDLTTLSISDWQADTEYLQDSIVKVDNIYYIARKRHTSSLANAPVDTPVKIFTTHAASGGMTEITCTGHGFQANDEIVIFGVRPYDIYRGWHTVVSATDDAFIIDTPFQNYPITSARVHKGLWEKAEQDKYLGIPEYGYRYGGGLERNATQGDKISANAAAPYRTNWGWPLHGAVLTADIMDLKDEWNHKALFDYIDRYVSWFAHRTQMYSMARCGLNIVLIMARSGKKQVLHRHRIHLRWNQRGLWV